MRSFTNQQEKKRAKVEALFAWRPSGLFCRLMFVMSYSVRVEEDGDDLDMPAKDAQQRGRSGSRVERKRRIDGAIIQHLRSGLPVGFRSSARKPMEGPGDEPCPLKTWD